MKRLYLVTGFLGAGKTTFLKEMVQVFREDKIAIIVNEFGAEGVDGQVLREQGIESYEITNGSIFCVCRKDMFMDALNLVNKENVDIIIVETSGLSDPMTVDEILNYMESVYGDSFDFCGIISMIDAKNFLKVLNTAVVVENQVKSADLFIINKCDLVDDLSQIKKELLLRNQEAKLIETTYGKIEAYEVQNLTHKARELQTHKKDLILQKKYFEFERIISLVEFKEWLGSFKDLAYRVKGFIHTEEGTFNLECVMGDYELKPCTNHSGKSFVVVLYHANQLKGNEIGLL